MWSRTPAFLIALVTLAACGETGSPVRHSIVEACVRVPTASERVFRSAAEWSAFLTANRGTSAPVDFSTSMVAAHFDGEGSACVGYTVESVEEREGEIVVRATRHESPDPCIAVIAYPQLVITLDQRPENVRFEITRVQDRASTSTRSCV
jgi:hypothetical protein